MNRSTILAALVALAGAILGASCGRPDFVPDLRAVVAHQLLFMPHVRRDDLRLGEAAELLEVAQRNAHPCVKPLALARHLATLLLPPAAYAPRRLFVPFAGSGSECIGAMLAGWDEVVGVELSDEYADIARARLAWWHEESTRQPMLPMFADAVP